MMTFEGGPANGKNLMLDRCPLVLRVTHDAGINRWDALNCLDDVVHPSETIHVYILKAKPSPVHIHARKGGGWRFFGTYIYLETQPPKDMVRDNGVWSRWCDENRERLTPAWAVGKFK